MIPANSQLFLLAEKPTMTPETCHLQKWRPFEGFVGMALCVLLALPGCHRDNLPAAAAAGGLGAHTPPAAALPAGYVLPTLDTIESGAYHPLSRPLFLHVNKRAFARPEVAAFLRYYLNEGQALLAEVGSIRLTESKLAEVRAILDRELAQTPATEKLAGTIKIDGSSTVYPISQAVAEEFMTRHPGVKITVASSGTGGGFKKFTVGDTDINDSSRPIDAKEVAACEQNGIAYIELTIGIDGITVIVNSRNDWCQGLTVEQLKALWEPNSKIKTWKDLNPAWDDAEIKLYGPDPDSGTFDYFTEVIIGQAKKIRRDFNASADDNVLIVGVEGDRYALGYLGFAYYSARQEKLKALAIKD